MKFKTIVINILFFLSLLIFSCKKTEPTVLEPAVEVKKSNHSWYYFSENGFQKTEKIQTVPQSASIPWTEAIRISSSNVVSDSTDDTLGFAIVNRLGVLSFNNDKIDLSTDVTLFSERTAGNLVFYDDTPIFSVYKSSFFNNSIKNPEYKKDDSLHLFLVQFDTKSKIAFPIINCNNLTEEKNSEVTDFYWDGQNWTCSVKSISDVKNSFSYIEWSPKMPLLSIVPSSANANISVKESSVETFRELKKQKDFSTAPERIKKLLAGFSNSKSFEIELKNAGGISPRFYENKISSFKEKTLKAKGIIAESWSCILFEDGTLFIEGALPEKHILRNGKPVAIRLPKLPGGFVYSDFVISGTTLYAAWEETDFYSIKRSGFLSVDLEKTLYKELI